MDESEFVQFLDPDAGAIAYLHPALPGAGKRPVLANVLPPDGAAPIQSLQVLSGRVAWVLTSGADGRSYLYATEDGGRTWRKLSIPAGAAFGIQLLDARHGTLQLRDGLYATSDAGTIGGMFSCLPARPLASAPASSILP